MSLSLVKKGLKNLDEKYSVLSTGQAEPVTSESKLTKRQKVKKPQGSAQAAAKLGLSKASDFERFRHSQAFIETVKKLDPKKKEQLPKPIDLARKEKKLQKKLLKKNIEKLQASQTPVNDTLKDLQSEVLNYQALHGPKPVRRLKKRVAKQAKEALMR